METCPLCWNSANAAETRAPDGGLRAAKTFDCGRCGHFEITEEQLANCMSMRTEGETDQRHLLSALTRKATEEGGPALVLTTERARTLLETTEWPSAHEQNVLFLGYLVRKQKRRGESVAVTHKTDYPLFFAKGERESTSIARELADAGCIKVTNQGATNYYMITPKGRDELDRLHAKPAKPGAPAQQTEPMAGVGGPSGTALPHAHPPQQTALDMIDSALTELDAVVRAQAEGSEDRIMRWCERSTQRLRENVAQREAERFAELVPRLFASAAHASHITDRCRAFLRALRADIELSPEMVMPAQLVRTTADARTGGSSPAAPAPEPAPPHQTLLDRIWRFMREHGWAFEGIGTQAIVGGVTILVAGALVLWRWFGPPPTPAAPTASPTTPAQAQSLPRVIFDLVVEGRLACTSPEGRTAEESGPGSPAEPAYIEGEAGYEELQPLQPVRVLSAGNVATLVNRFGLAEVSRLRGSSTDYLLGFQEIRLPIMVSPSTKWDCLAMQSYEITVSLNGSEVWSKRQPLSGRRWQGGGSFGTDLKALHSQLRQAIRPTTVATP